MKTIGTLFAIFAIAQVASALNCYSCDADKCRQDESHWTKIPNCGKAVADTKHVGACVKQVYLDKVTNQESTLRRCIIGEKTNDGVKYNCPDTDGKVVTCQVCTSDYCNSASAVSFSFITLLSVLAAYLVPKLL